MKRMFAGLLCLLLLAGCAVQEQAEPREDLIVVGFSQVGAESNWRVANTESMKATFSEENGFELIFDDARQKQENQLMAIRTFIQQEVDYIVLAPVTETGWEGVLAEARAAGIPVIVVDRQVDVSDDGLYTCWVGSDFLMEAELAMDWLEEELRRQGKAEEEVRFLHLQGTEGATAQIQRTAGLEKAMARHENWTMAAQLQAEFTEAKAYEVVKELLKKDRTLDVIYCENDNMAFGAIRALEEAGIPCGPGDDITIISFDAVRSALESCLAGQIDLCVECNPLHGPRVENLIRQLEGGAELPKESYVEGSWFSTETLTREIIDERVY